MKNLTIILAVLLSPSLAFGQLSAGRQKITNLADGVAASDAATFGQVSAAGSGISELTGCVTAGPGSGAQATAVTNACITLPKLELISTGMLLGNNSGGNLSPFALTAAQVKTLLGIAAGDVSGLAATATSTDAAGLSGTLACNRLPALSGGDVSSSIGTCLLTVGAATITLAKMANLAANSIMGNNTGGAATPIALTAAQVKTLLAIANTDVSGLGTMSTQNANALNVTGVTLLDGVPAPTIGTSAANRDYVLSVAAGSPTKAAVRVATTANGADATAFENGDTIDGTVLATGDRFLRKDQTTATENGIFTVNASGAPTRATDSDTGAEILAGSTFVLTGTVNNDRQYVNTNDSAITIGVTNITYGLASDPAGKLTQANNLSDVASVATSRLNLGIAALTTKGDIYVRNASADIRLPVSTDGLCLKALASASTGLEWGTCAAGGTGLTHGEVMGRMALGGF